MNNYNKGYSFGNAPRTNKSSNYSNQNSLSSNRNISRSEVRKNYDTISFTNSDPKHKPIKEAKQKNNDNIEKYARKSSSSSQKSRLYKKHDLDDNNVFYEDSQQMRGLNMVRSAKPILICTFLTLFTFYLMLTQVHQFEGYCPNNAQCGVYINCDPGYQLNDDQYCKVSQEVVKNAEYICLSEIQTLKYQYGNSECIDSGSYKNLITPTKKVSEIIESFDIHENRALINEVYSWLGQRENWQKHKFILRDGKITPNQKIYTYKCYLYMFSQKQSAKYALLAFIVCLLGLFFWIRHRAMGKKSQQIYKYLKANVEQHSVYKISKDELEEIFGRISLGVWNLIENLRTKEGKILYYIDCNNIHWTKSPQ